MALRRYSSAKSFLAIFLNIVLIRIVNQVRCLKKTQILMSHDLACISLYSIFMYRLLPVVQYT